MRTLVFGQMILFCLALGGCQTGGGGGGGSSGGSSGSSGANTGNEGGSEPINPSEEKAYKQAILKCYKTGGTRVVKIEGTLKCY